MPVPLPDATGTPALFTYAGCFAVASSFTVPADMSALPRTEVIKELEWAILFIVKGFLSATSSFSS